MASITIRGLDDEIKERLRVRAVLHDCSMSEEARGILNAALSKQGPIGHDLGESSRFAPLGGRELANLPREPMRRYRASPKGDPSRNPFSRSAV